LTHTTDVLRTKIKAFFTEIEELSSNTKEYERELKAANKAIEMYRNTSETRRLKGLNDRTTHGI